MTAPCKRDKAKGGVICGAFILTVSEHRKGSLSQGMRNSLA